MSSNTFLISDTHFSHKGIVQFIRPDGTKVRPWDNTEEMDEALVKNWNSVVRPQDKIYHLGDVVINRKALPILSRLNGTKILIKGNHDVFRLEEYTPYFKDIRACSQLSGMMLTHIPIHPREMNRFGINVHGHLHTEQVMSQYGTWDGVVENSKGFIDERYICVSVEQIGYTPISLEDLKKKLKERNNA